MKINQIVDDRAGVCHCGRYFKLYRSQRGSLSLYWCRCRCGSRTSRSYWPAAVIKKMTEGK